MARSTAVVVGALVALAGCYRPERGRCAVTCADGVTCPGGLTCGADRFCHAADDTGGCTEADAAPPSSGYTQIAAGAAHACAIDHDGALWCWGGNEFAQVGHAGEDPVATPSLVSSSGWTAIAPGSNHTCGVEAGMMKCWGRDDHGQAGDPSLGNVETPTQVGSATDWFAVAAGRNDFSCGLRGNPQSGGRAYCWGSDYLGQLGDGDGDSTGYTPREVGTSDGVDRFDDFVEIHAGESSTCARRASGSLYCWGNGDSGRLGDGDEMQANVPKPVSGGPYGAFAIGQLFGCALAASDGSLWCWGDNTYGELARTRGSPNKSDTPVQSPIGGGFTSVAAALTSGCVGGATGAICFGIGSNGQAGDGTWVDPAAPTAVSVLGAVTAITAGDYYACAIEDGNAYCWGANGDGQLGDGNYSTKRTPVQVGTANDWQHVVTYEGHTCGLRAGGHLWCWGWNERHQLGVPSVVESSAVPVEVTAADQWLSVAPGLVSTCATRQGTGPTELWCWGDNTWSSVGNGDPSPGPFDPAEISHKVAGWDHLAAPELGGCALSGGARYCWGNNDNDVLGNGGNQSVGTPTMIAGESIAWTQLSFGGNFACGITASELYCWGANDSGQQGRGDHLGGPFPSPVMTMAGGWTDLSAAVGGGSACAIDGGVVKCWGYNNYGGLGNDSATELDAPTPIMTSATGWTQVSVGYGHACGIAGTDLYCWGENTQGELGDTSINYSTGIPTRIAASHTWREVSCGSERTCAITTDNLLFCWGYGQHGQLGDGSRDEPSPVRTAR